MGWTSIVSYISFKQIAECLDIQTDTSYVSAGNLTSDGADYVFDKVADYCADYKRQHKKELSEELRIRKENDYIQDLLNSYMSPEDLVKRIDWVEKFKFVNNYTNAGSKFSFLSDQPCGDSLAWFETPDGYMLTLFQPIMIFINDMHYYEESTLPEFNYEEVAAPDVISALEQAFLLKICNLEKEIEEFVY